MTVPQGDFNPFVDDNDAVEDSIVTERPEYVERPVDEEYLPDSHPKPTLEELQEELPPETTYDFEAEISRIIEDMTRDEPLPLPLPPVEPLAEPVEVREEPPAMDKEEALEDFPELEMPSLVEDSLLPAPAPSPPADAFADFDLEEMFPELDLTPAAEEEPVAYEPSAEPMADAPVAFDAALELDFAPAVAEEPAEEAPPPADISFPGFDFAELEADIAAEDEAQSAAPSFEDEEMPEPLWDDPEDAEEAADEDDAEDAAEAEDPLAALLAEEDDFVPPANPFAAPAEDLSEVEPLGEPEAATEEDEEETEGPKGKRKKPKAPKAKKKRFDFSQTIANIKSELRGGDEVNGTPASSMGPSSKKAVPPKNVLTGEVQGGSKPEEEGASGANKLKEIAAKVAKPYTVLGGYVLAGLMAVLGILSKLPGLGAVASKLAAKEALLRRVAYVLPLVVLMSFFTWHGGGKYGPEKSSITFPDGGAASFSQFAYDSGSKTATGKITNTGDVIAKVTPVFVVYAISPSLNPLSLFYPEAVGECRGSEQQVEIGKSETVKVSCDANIGGFRKKVSGELEW